MNVDQRQRSLIAVCFDFAEENNVNRVYICSFSKLKTRILNGVIFPTHLIRFRDFSELLFIRFAASERSVYELSVLLMLLLVIQIQYLPVH